jgi:hypothetical protein
MRVTVRPGFGSNDVNELIERLRRSGVLDEPSLRKGIEQYTELQRSLINTPDVTKATDFQKKFRSFYRVRRGPAWQIVFFEFMQKHRTTPPSFQETLMALMAQEHHCEASFASKLVATLNPQCPVLDSLVLRVMRTHLGDHGSSEGKWTLLRQGSLESRIERALIVYGCLTAAVDDILGAADFTKLIKLFDISYGQYPLTATKKLDLMLWRYGAMLLKKKGEVLRR